VAAALRAKNGWPMPSLAPGEFISGLRFDPSAPACPVGPNAQKIQVNGYPLDGMPIPRDVLLPGQQQRLRIINAQSNGYLDVAMRGPTGAPEVLTVVGRDGIPINATSDAETVALPNNPMDVQLPPGGRVDIVVTGQPRDQTLISDDKVCTGPAGPLTKLYQLALVGPGAAAHASALRAVPVPIKTVLPNATRAGVALAHHGHVIIDRYLTFSQYGDANFPFYVTATQPRAADVVENPFWLKRSTTPRDPNYYLEPNITTRQGNVERWHFINVTPEVHAFHIHQLTFLGLDSSVPDQRPRIANVRLDTILLPPGEVVKGKVTPDGYPILEATETVILIDFTNVDAGTFVYHCHMLFHEDHGMMGIIRVLPSPPPAMKT
jgi:FtsP/CotA-like multicopper oxidase with cupredoxin domain